ncbi:MAG: hypothetical protein IJE68_01575 [Clostridia bacterium]|nr:hypothetical protein [Clostridia bacterium]
MKNNFEDTMIFKKGNKNILKNKELNNLIQFQLDKTNIEEKDLLEIKDIVLNGRKINGDINIVDFNEIDLFPNLQKIELKNLEISKQNMEKLKKLDDIYLKNCNIESIEEIKNVKNISINNCIIEDFQSIDCIQDLEELEIVNMPIVNFDFLKKLKRLKVLKIKNVKGFSLDKINFVLPIEYLSVEGIEDLEEEYLTSNYPNLEILSIELAKNEEWSENLEKIKQKGIKILLNDIYEY